jgi:mono/diheme cytochrome c family protein
LRILVLILIICSSQFFLSWEDPKEGAALFEAHCRDCHSDDFRQRKTGPALGNVHLYRNREWLIKFIQNAPLMVKTDELAACVHRMNGKKIMTANYFLKKNEIEAILDFIELESRNQKIGKDEISFPCK